MGRFPLVIEHDPDEPECAIAFVDVLVDGRSYPFVLDTGARRSTIVADDWTMTLPRVGSGHVSGVFESRATDLVLVPQIELGAIRATSIPMNLTDPDDADADSLLGLDVLGAYALHLDLLAGTLETVTSDQRGEPLERDLAGHCFVPVAWPDVTARACIDTGAAMTVVNRVFFDSHPQLFSAARTSHGQGNGGPVVETPTYRIDGYAIGEVGFGPHVVAVVELPAEAAGTDLILGFPTLAQAVWTLDLPADRWAAAHRST